MIYGRCLYHILISAVSEQRLQYPVTRGEIRQYIKHACVLQRCELLKANIGAGFVSLLVYLDFELSIEEFINEMKSVTSAWIVGMDSNDNYWKEDHFMYEVSPEDRSIVESVLATSPDFVPQIKTQMICYHIIMLTSRCRLLIPQRYKRLTAEVTTEVAQNLGANPIACSAMRNHVHLLCFVPTTISISEYIAKLREGLKEHILNNRHLRRIEDWSDESIVFTVSTYKISKEEIYVLDQDYIHSRSRLVNEMSPLYQRLNIPYVVSLH